MKKVLKLSSSNCLKFNPETGRIRFWENQAAMTYITAAGNVGVTKGTVLKVYRLVINWKTGELLVIGRCWEATVPVVDFILATYGMRSVYRETRSFPETIEAFKKKLVNEHIHFKEV